MLPDSPRGGRPRREVLGVTIVMGNHTDVRLLGRNACVALALYDSPARVYLGADRRADGSAPDCASGMLVRARRRSMCAGQRSVLDGDAGHNPA